MSKITLDNENNATTLYQLLAKKHGVTPRYIGQINRNEKKPTRGIGLKIKKELEKINQELKESQNNINQ